MSCDLERLAPGLSQTVVSRAWVKYKFSHTARGLLRFSTICSCTLHINLASTVSVAPQSPKLQSYTLHSEPSRTTSRPSR